MIRTIAVAFSLILAVLVVLPWFVLWSLLSGKPDAMYWMAMSVVRFETRMLGVRVRTEGLENVPNRPSVFVANHASSIDPMALIPVIPQRVGILAKQELFRIPIFARAMRVAQFVPVDRADKESTTAAIPLAMQNLAKGLSYMIFPEGTRSPDGRLRPFKRGAFTLAIEAGVPVVPVSIAGAHRVLGKGETFVHPGEVTIRFALPVETSTWTMDRRAELVSRVQALVVAGLPPDQQPL